MKALTVKHPWAWSIVNGGKNVENRSRRTNYRGQLYIHAAKTIDMDAMFDPQVVHATDAWIIRNAEPGVFGRIQPVDLSTTGMVIGTVDIIGCHHSYECEADYSLPGACSGWAMPGYYHWELANAQPVTPFPAKGKLGIWNLGEAA